MEKKYERIINTLDNKDRERELYERCRPYLALYSQLKEKNFEEDWKKYDILLDSQKGILIEYKKCFSAKETAIDEECLSMLDLVLPDNSMMHGMRLKIQSKRKLILNKKYIVICKSWQKIILLWLNLLLLY